jgi:hypothetical protein
MQNFCKDRIQLIAMRRQRTERTPKTQKKKGDSEHTMRLKNYKSRNYDRR